MSDYLLDLDSVIESIEISSGTENLIDIGLKGRLESMLSKCESNTAFTIDQKVAIRRQFVALLARRLNIAHDIQKYPDILDEKIVAPVFIIGFARTGTSIQQSLLVADPGNRGVEAWQVHAPSPPPGQGPVAPQRLVAADQVVQHFCNRCPGIMTLHPYWDQLAHTLVEDEEVLTLDLWDNFPVALCDVPDLSIRTGSDDFEGAYHFLKTFMQHQQWKQPNKRWVMKGIEHQRHLRSLFKVFPDARCLFVHREPEEFLPSNLAIAAVVYDGITNGGLDRRTLAAGYLQDFQQRLQSVLADPVMDDSRVRHMTFHDFINKPIAALAECYGEWNFDWSTDGEVAMQAWLDDPANNGSRYGRHKYSFEPFGLDWETVSPTFDAYRERFLSK